jgi:hypothetical protein
MRILYPLFLTFLALLTNGGAQLINLAPTGTASSSSEGYQTVAGAGNDGNRTGNYSANGPVFHTLNEAIQSYWQVQLPGPRYLDHVRIFNRVDAVQGSVGNFRIVAKNAGTTVFSQDFLPVNATDQNGARAWGTSALRGVVADFVRIERLNQTPNFMTFAEFEIWGSVTARDPLIVASGATASPAGFSSLASDAIDGDINGNLNGPGVPIYHSLSQGVGQFWEMTLPTEFRVTNLLIFNRTDGVTTTNARVSLRAVSGGPVLWTQDVNLSQGATTPFNYGFALAPNTNGRVVRIETLGNEFLALAEVQAFGVPGTIEAPIVENLAATGVAASVATLQANVTKTGYEAPNVKVYFGTTDGGMVAANWAQVRDLGPQGGAASVTVSGLEQARMYYFRAFAQNSAGSDWADASGTFTTNSAVPATLTLAPAQGVTGYTALFNGRVLTAGNDAPAVTLYWGQTDGGTSTAAWTSSLGLGTNTGLFGTLAGNLQPNATYFFRAAASNAAGTAWSESRTFATNALPPVVINEIHYKPQDRTRNTEFIELWNPSAAAVDLSGWRLADAVDFVFPAGSTLAAGGYRVVAGNAAAFQQYYGLAPGGQYAGTLKNSGEPIELRTGAGMLVDRVDYERGFPWPTAADGAGPSIELIHPGLDNKYGGAWRSSTKTPLPQTPGAQNSVFGISAPPAVRQVVHTPAAPTAGQAVVISAAIADGNGVASAKLQYQMVDPGGYIRKTDAAYATNWTEVAMNDAGTDGDAVAGDGVFTVTLPANVQVHRRLVRYRLSTTNALGASVTVPYADDEQPNFAYFVYNGVPAWSGALQPGAAAPRGTVQTFPGATLASIPPWHLIANATDVSNSQYNSGFDDVRFYSTLVYEGVVYDHIRFKNRGQGSTYVSGKNKWSLNFNRARDIRVRDNWGGYYETWNSVALDANASPWCALHRGATGVDEASSYRMYDLAGVPALRTTYVHWRVIDAAAESGATQFDGDFWGLYLALEPMEGNFIDQRGLPEGNIYDITGSQGDKQYQASTQSADASDWNAYRDAANAGGQTEAWYRANLDLKALYTFHALNRLNGNVDLRPGDNLRYYHRSSDNRWVIAPYDLDMMFVCGSHWSANLDGVTYPGVADQFRAITRHPAIAVEFRNRARELLDLFASDAATGGGQVGQLIDEYGQLVNPAGPPQTWAAADAAMWNLNPSTAGSGATNSNSGYSSHKNNFFRSPYFDFRGVAPVPTTNWTRTLPDADASGYGTFNGLMTWFTNYATNTWPGGTWARSNGDQRGYGYKFLEWESLYGGLGINPTTPDLSFPATPAISYTGPANYPADGLNFTTTAFAPSGSGGTSFGALQWRVGEIRGPGVAGYVAGQPRKYEIEEVWTSPELTSFAVSVHLPVAVAKPGSTYRARVRHKDANGRWSHWSAPHQFTVTQPNVSVYQQAIVVSELHYNPAPATQDEIAAGWSTGDFEWIELKNIGGFALDFTGVRFTKGVDFDFPAGYTIPGGGFALVVKNLTAFQLRYGHAHDAVIAGTYGGDNLNNLGEQLKLSLGAGTGIVDFSYDIAPPWPSGANGLGYSLTLRAPDTRPDHTFGGNWKASAVVGGSPGTDELLTFETWAVEYPGATDLATDTDRDGYSNLVEYALGSSPVNPAARHAPVGDIQEFTVGGITEKYFTLTYARRKYTSDLQFAAEFSSDLTLPWVDHGVLVGAGVGPDDTVLETWRASTPVSQGPQYGRVRVTKP